MSESPLIALPSIYDAAIEQDRWIAALNDMVRPTGAKATALIVVEQGNMQPYSVNQVSDLYRTHISPEDLQYYIENLSPLEIEAWERMKTAPKQRIVEDNEIWPNIDEIRHRADYRYLEEKVGIFRRAVSRLNDNRCWYDTAIFQFDASMTEIPGTSLQSAQLLLPHLAKAIELGRSFSLLRMHYRAVLSALDHVQIGMCIALGQGDIIVANTEAERIFSLEDGIKLNRDRHLLFRDSDLGQAVEEAVRTTAQTVRGQNDVAEVILAVSRPSSEHPFLIEIAPLRDQTGEVESKLEGALITIIDPANPRPFSTAKAATAYGLTPAEASVCAHLVDGWTNGRIAEERGVTIDTVKAQIASIMQKTGTQRRSELIRLVLRSSPPIEAPGQVS